MVAFLFYSRNKIFFINAIPVCWFSYDCFGSCQFQNRADLLVYNAAIYTVDTAFSVAEAMVIKDGKIVETGKLSDLEKNIYRQRKTECRG